jgi:antitoxin component YwqK of YwqJK toxin-antitoxin module
MFKVYYEHCNNIRIMHFKTAFVIFSSLLSFSALGQQPRYNFKSFVREIDSTEFKVIYPKKDGFLRTYIAATDIQIWDIDDDNTTYMMGSENVLLCFEGHQKDNKKDGVYNIYIIDSSDHSKRYRIWEENYSNDKLNGEWRTYTLRGTLVRSQTFKNDSLNGITRDFFIDGKTVSEEKEYFNGHNKYVRKQFYKNGQVSVEAHYADGKMNGNRTEYYEDGTQKETAEFKDGLFNGVRKYFYPNGQLWIEQIYRNGKSWTVVANYTDKGQKRDAGTLHEGNGTIVFYNEDGTVRQIVTYIDGDEIK